jgi:beta-mannanase
MTLDKWTDEMSQAVAQMALGFNRQGVKVWLRFAWEMNGGWYEYGNDPTNYKIAFQDLANVVKQTTNETWMLWAPNVRYGETESLAGYEPYYPGEQCTALFFCFRSAQPRLIQPIRPSQT